MISSAEAPVPKRAVLGPSVHRAVEEELTRQRTLHELNSMVLTKLGLFKECCPLCTAQPDVRELKRTAPQHKLNACPVLLRGKLCIACFRSGHLASHCTLRQKSFTPWSGVCNACTLGLGQEQPFHKNGEYGAYKCQSVGKDFILQYCMALYTHQQERLKSLVRNVDETDKRAFAYWGRSQSPTDADVRAFAAWLYKPLSAEAKLSKAAVLILTDIWSSVDPSDLKKRALCLLQEGKL
jgi:hypothetical protein